MELAFDISQDELPIFLAEVDEHLQTLDEILVQLEQAEERPELLQSAFRAAHTLKGMAGIIGHHRMTDLTHALETAFDSVRKGMLHIATPLIDLCLDAVDGLRLLRDEVVTGEVCDVDVERLVEEFEQMNGKTTEGPGREGPLAHAAEGAAGSGNGSLSIEVAIDPASVASAARAFQVMMALQEVGEILEMSPTLDQIETAAPVQVFRARVACRVEPAEVARRVAQISEVFDIKINGQAAGNDGQKPSAAREARPDPGTGGRGNGQRNTAEMTVRTSVERLDKLMNLVGELITDRNHLYQLRAYFEQEKRGNGAVDRLAETVTHLGRITDQLQEEVMSIRMLPVGSVFHKFPRMVRDMAQKTGKQIDLVIHGEDTELDRSMLEEINDPLIHLVRNSVDHGLEMPEERIAAGKPPRGTITLTARHEQGRIVLTVSDDGRGIDPDKLRKAAVQRGLLSAEEVAALSDEQAIDLIFMPGFSTAEKVTDISGRGVGMDIVHTNIQRVNGSIQVETKKGEGTTFQITLPLTLAIVPTLLVRVNGVVLAIPLVMITETLRLSREEIRTIRGQPVTMLRGSVLALIDLKDLFGIQGKRPLSEKYTYAVVVHSGKQRVGLVVDTLIGEEEVVVKSLGALVGEIPGISSAAILGDGKVALIVDVPGLLRFFGIH